MTAPSAVTSAPLSSTVANDPEREWKEAFALFDKQGRGSISASELRVILEQLGAKPSDKELAQYLGAVDANGDGRVEWHEFVTLMTRKVSLPGVTSSDLRTAFRALDQQGSGKVHAGELRYVLTGVGGVDQRLSGEEVDELLKELGCDENGMLDYEALLGQLLA